MSKLSSRRRNQTLVITEGNHEKNKLLKLILLAFPEINISENNIVMYESNIYSLYAKIVYEYGTDWQEQDVDLPKCVAKWKNLGIKLEKRDFTNVILIFDYERQDPNFSETKICDLQKYFSDISDMGQLYINYPMVEAFYHMKSIPDPDYNTYTASLQELKDKAYKARVHKENRNHDYRKFAQTRGECDVVIKQNIEKAWLITSNQAVVSSTPAFIDILKSQVDKILKEGLVYVLCTCAFYIFDYNPKLIL